METLPLYISIVFILITLLTLWFIFKAGAGICALVISGTWLIIQAVVASTGFYTNTQSIPPRLMFLLFPAVATIVALLTLKPARSWLNNLDTKWLTYLHMVRVPVEITLFLLFVNGKVPQLMTFEGSNFDIISGITAPVVAYWSYTRSRLSKPILLMWNLICLTLLFNIVTRAILSAPYPFQQLGFEQPNVAILYFPFVWLPGFVVPAVLFSHLVCIRRILINPLHIK